MPQERAWKDVEDVTGRGGWCRLSEGPIKTRCFICECGGKFLIDMQFGVDAWPEKIWCPYCGKPYMEKSGENVTVYGGTDYMIVERYEEFGFNDGTLTLSAIQEGVLDG